jgi:hypothetical protein
MSWASRRKLSLIIALLVIAALIALAGYFLFVYEPPTCFDGRRNGAEEGVDCGGGCALLCSAQVSAPAVLWARALPVTKEVYNAVALVKNTNVSAGTERIAYAFSLYDADNLLVAERRGETFLAPGETAPVFEASIIVGERAPSRAFLTFEPTPRFFRDASSPERPSVSGIDFSSEPTPRLTATIGNPSYEPLGRIVVVAILYDGSDTAMAASQTVLDSLPGRGARDVVFTWPFSIGSPARIEVLPRVMQGSAL